MTDTGGISRDALRSFIRRIENLEEEKKNMADDIKDVYSEAKGAGFDVKVMKQIVKRRKMDEHERQEQDALLDLYEDVLSPQLSLVV